MSEVWKPIKGYEGIYEVSDLGRVRSLDRMVQREYANGTKFMQSVRGRILKNSLNNIGYYAVNLHKENKPKSSLVHRLVAKAFIPNPDNLPSVNHKDENKLNNRADNLEWCDTKYNTNYGTSIQRKTEKTRMKVCQYDLHGNFIKEYPSSLEASQETDVDRSLISKCCRNERITAGGYIWKYV